MHPLTDWGAFGPARTTRPLRAIIHGPGWLGRKDALLYEPYHRALTAAGFGVLVIDHRGFSKGDAPENLTLSGQVRDLENAVRGQANRRRCCPVPDR